MKTKYTAESIQCYPVNMDKLNTEAKRICRETDTIKYHVDGAQALVKSPKIAIIDDEFVGGKVSKEVTFNVFKTEYRPSGSKVFSCLPSYEVTLTLAGLEEYLNAPVSLAEFTKERRGYNSRIKANESSWMDYFNS